jgi:hypothetical protein
MHAGSSVLFYCDSMHEGARHYSTAILCVTDSSSSCRNGTSCINNNPCPPVDCVGSWVPDGDCVGGCGGARTGGSRPER